MLYADAMMQGFMHRMQIDLPPVSPICNTQTGRIMGKILKRIMRRIMERIMRRILEVIIDRDQGDKPERKNSGRQKVFSECTAKGGGL
ncbi:MAG: hypothetical protein K2O98_05240 [Lachnospiraceae bacterium]|nr:hypothetical protein [Lachnospiraceae bacterium]